MNPASFQYQPLNIQRPLVKPPNFLSNKNLDKSAPHLLPNKQFTYSPQILSKEGDGAQNPNKSTYLPHRQDTPSNPLTPKGFT